MSAPQMHPHEFIVTTNLVRRLIDEQFPEWSTLPLMRCGSPGTDNAVFRLGTDLSVRMPRVDWAVAQVALEEKWLPILATQLRLDLPTPVAIGLPAHGYPWNWSVHQWIEGSSAIDAPPSTETAMCDLAERLAGFIMDLQSIRADDAPKANRGVPLSHRYAGIENSFDEMSEWVDESKLRDAWTTCLGAKEWEHTPVLVHGDLLPGNLLMSNDQLVAVIDFSGFGYGDPACDYISAWAILDNKSRALLRVLTGVDDATWNRARGHAIGQAVQFIPYYKHSNQLGVDRAVRSLLAAVQDPEF